MTAAPTALQAPQRDIDAVRDAALDYIDGYTTGDAPRQAAPITPGIKRRFLTDADTGVERLQVLSPRIMADYTATVGSNLAANPRSSSMHLPGHRRQRRPRPGDSAGLRGAGATVVVSGRNPDKNRTISAELGDADAVVAFDVRDQDSVRAAMAQIVDRRGRIDVLVNNAGNAELSPVSETSLDGWRAVIDTHLTGAFLCSKHAATAMVERDDGGKIINIGSMYSVYGAAGIASYGTAKTGILGLTRALAVELAEHGIQVNAILPGWFETDLTRGMPDSEWGRIIRRKTPAGRWGKPGDLVGAAVFLASAAPSSSLVRRCRWTAAT